MAKQIRKTDISEADLFGDIKKSAERSIGVLKKLDESLKKTAESIKKVVQSTKGANLNEINKLNQAFKQSNEVKQQSVKINQEIQNQQKIARQAAIEEEKLKQQKIKTQQAELRQAKQLEQQKRKNIKQLNDERNAYQKLVIKTRDQKNESKRLGARLLELEQSGKKNTRAYRELASEYRKVTRAAQQGDKQLKKLDRTVGDNFRNVGNYRSALGKLQGALGSLGVAFGSAMIIRNVAGTMADFDQSVADLSAIMGKTKDEIKELTEQAKELGATTRFTASEIVSLQIELAKLGFEPEQIQDSTEAVSNLAAATGADLASAAALAGSTMKAFRLEASEMDRVASVLAVSTTKSALDFSKLETSMSTIAPVAKAFGFSVEDTTALLGVLSNSGFDASTAATSTRKILLKMADANSELAQSLGGPVKNVEELAVAFKKLQEDGTDLAEALELTDVRSVAAFKTFLEGTDDLVKLKEGITDANQELKDMAEKRLDSVNGQLALLNSAWEGYIINLTESSGTTNTLKDIIGFLARNLETILSTIGKAIKAFILYKTVVLATRAATWLFTGGLQRMIVQMALAVKGMKGMVTGTRSAAVGFRTLGTAMKSVPLLLVIGLLADLVFGLMDATDKTEELTDAESELNDQLERGNELRAERIKSQKTIDDQFAIRNNLSQAQLKNLKNEIEAEIALSEIADAKIKTTKRSVEEINKERDAINERIKAIQEEQKETDKLSMDIDAMMRKNQEALKDFAIPEELKKSFEQRSKEAELRELLNKEIELENELKGEGINISDDENANLELRKKQLKEIIPLIKEETNNNNNRNNSLKETEKKLRELENLRDAEAKRRADILEKLAQLEDEYFQTKISNEQKEINAVREKYFLIMEEAKKYGEDITTLEEALADEIDKIRKRYILIEGEEEIENAYKKRNMIIAENEANSVINQNEAIEQKLLSEMVYLNNLIYLYEKNGKDVTELKTQLYETDLALQQHYIDKSKKIEQKDLENYKSIAQTKIEIAKSVTQIITEQSNKRIEQIDKEIQASQKQQDTLRALAEQGNIDAQESLAEQRQLEIELQKQREAELKRQAQIQLAASAYETYQNNVASGKDSKQALAETIKDITLLTQFVKSLPAFEKGTEDTGTHGQGVDGKGGFKAILHPNERVMTKEQNKMVGNLSNMELAQIAQDYNTGKLLEKGEGASQIGGAWSSVAIVKKLDELQKTIQNKPEIEYKVEEILDGVMKLRKSEKRGNTIVHNKYRIK